MDGGRHSRGRLAMVAMFLASCTEPQPPPQPPPPPPPAHIPAEAFVDSPLNDSGEPVLLEVPLGNDRLQLVYDDTRLDAIRFWGECLGRVSGCYATNGGSIDGCVELIELCESERGATGCCPEACVQRYRDARAGGLSDDAAVDASFAQGECIPGFAERAAELGMETWSPVSP